MVCKVTFPRGFVWGAAASAYQIEGAYRTDGRGASIWDTFTHAPGAIRNGDTGDIACDHYNRWREDVALMKQIGVQAYRLSLSWTRILPDGRGKVNQKGLDFYRELLEGLRAADIEPYINLYHWDLPQALQDAGGWDNRATVDAFVEFADVASRRLGDLCDQWITLNEPAVDAFAGHWFGFHAPGKRDLSLAIRVSHHLLLAHGRAVAALRSNAPAGEVGIVVDINLTLPRSHSADDYNAYRHADGYLHRWFLDPLYWRGYPADMLRDWREWGYIPGDDLGGALKDGDLKAIAAPLDHIGLNFYRREVGATNKGADGRTRVVTKKHPDSVESTDMDWDIYPHGIFEIVCRVHFDYRPPKIYLSENGFSFADGPDADGRVRDARRIDCLRRHLAALRRTIDAGAPLAGYFLWSFMDNFEWAQGYAQRFGAIWVDFETQARILKDSAYWYQSVIAANGFEME